MKILKNILLTVVILTTGLFANEKIGSVSFMIGAPSDVQIQHINSKAWNPVKIGTPVLSQDKIKTNDESRCEVILDDKSIIRIGENTVFEFTESQNANGKLKTRSNLKKGKVWANLSQKSNRPKDFQIKTPTAVCAVRGTIYRVNSDSSTKCLVYDGKVDVGPASFWGQPIGQKSTNSLAPVEVSGPTEVPGPFEVSLDEWVQIVKGYQIEVLPDGKFAKSKFNEFVDSQNDWVQWNQQLDQQK